MACSAKLQARMGRSGLRRQGGIVLIMALILLVVISTTAVLAVKGAMSGEQVSNNIRVNMVATQSAETALRYCENLVIAGGAPVLLLPLSNATGIPSVWSTRSNWTATNIITVPTDVVDSSDSAGRTTAVVPLCMVEEMRLPVLTTSGYAANYLITSRGFSQDYRTASTNGAVLAGSEVWMQSVLRY
ncbi:MAG: hypothetical protein V4614_00925 [Pseudomonadota bacterium]